MIDQKKCVACGEIKNVTDYFNHSGNADSYRHECKPCHLARGRKYLTTELGVITKIYNRQRESSIGRGHELPNYTKLQFSEWMYKNGFYGMYCQWCWSGFDKSLKPSPDRLDQTKPYTLCNLQLVTWAENKNLGHKSRQKPVLQIDSISGVVIASFSGQKEAEKITGITNINRAVNTGRIAGGYRWSKQTNQIAN